MSEVVRGYYDRKVEREWGRLDRPYRRLELVTTLYLIERYFPREGHLADIGGGPGRYTVELLRRGYRVTLVDLSPRAVAFAEAKLAELGLQVEAVLCADARDLIALPTEAFDGALLMGPLYHIVDEAGRAQALGELRRVLKPGAPAVVAFLNPWGILRAGLAEFPEAYRKLDDMRGLLTDWVQTGEQRAFTEAVFLTPPRALGELQRAGFDVVTYAGAEGFAAGMLAELEQMATADPEAYANVLRLAEETCELPQYRDVTEHLHAVVRKPW
ncbi:class I SAM-dependent methyltransferase [Candidatus Bipolaricaulota bacterium]|nr:class I SAM-dependent methyltransferase [Candidatus Bipolaricaulota bacterium]